MSDEERRQLFLLFFLLWVATVSASLQNEQSNAQQLEAETARHAGSVNNDCTKEEFFYSPLGTCEDCSVMCGKTVRNAVYCYTNCPRQYATMQRGDRLNCQEGEFLYPPRNVCVVCSLHCPEPTESQADLHLSPFCVKFCANLPGTTTVTSSSRCGADQFFHVLLKRCIFCSTICTRDKPVQYCMNNCPLYKAITVEKNCAVDEFFHGYRNECIACQTVCGTNKSSEFCTNNCPGFLENGRTLIMDRKTDNSRDRSKLQDNSMQDYNLKDSHSQDTFSLDNPVQDTLIQDTQPVEAMNETRQSLLNDSARIVLHNNANDSLDSANHFFTSGKLSADATPFVVVQGLFVLVIVIILVSTTVIWTAVWGYRFSKWSRFLQEATNSLECPEFVQGIEEFRSNLLCSSFVSQREVFVDLQSNSIPNNNIPADVDDGAGYTELLVG